MCVDRGGSKTYHLHTISTPSKSKHAPFTLRIHTHPSMPALCSTLNHLDHIFSFKLETINETINETHQTLLCAVCSDVMARESATFRHGLNVVPNPLMLFFCSCSSDVRLL